MSSKWLFVRDVQAPAPRVARRCLRSRLRWVWRQLQLVTADEGSVTAMHQLRVATRRASTALESFDCLFGEQDFRWLHKQLKRLRRAAGHARDLDVLFATTTSIAADNCQPAVPSKVLQFLQAHASAARQPLLKLQRRLERKDFPARCQSNLRQATPQSSTRKISFREFSQQSLQQLWVMFQYHIAQDLGQIEALHEVRLSVKSLRYALELFHAALPSEAAQRLYDDFVNLQEQLGQVNDHAVAIELLNELSPDLAGKKTAAWIANELQRRSAAMVAAQQQFLQTWPTLRAKLLQDWEQVYSVLVTTNETAAVQPPADTESLHTTSTITSNPLSHDPGLTTVVTTLY